MAGIHVPSFHFDTPVFREAKDGEGYSYLAIGSPHLAVANMVSSVAGDLLILLPLSQDILTDAEGHCHPMALMGHLPLATWRLSGDPAWQEEFQIELSKLFRSHGVHQPNQHIAVLGDCGLAGVCKRVQIPFQPL